MLIDWDKRFPGRIASMFQALGNVAPSHLLDPKLYNFQELKASHTPDPDGDRAFDTSFPEPTAEQPIEFISPAGSVHRAWGL
jgi:tRNA 2-thiocytidine biosynthesis protein TtcA